MDAFYGEIRIFGGNFAPRNWALCYGQTIPIAENQALFAILFDTFGGDARTTMGLPDLRGRAPLGAGQGLGLKYDYRLGEMWGLETETLSILELPMHAHDATVTGSITASLNASGDAATATGANNKFLAETAKKTYLNNINNAKKLNDGAITVDSSGLYLNPQTDIVGKNHPVNIMQPVIAVNYIICTVGIFPTRN